jgi:lipoprotein signal peptidase
MIRRSARCQNVHRNSLKSQGATVCLSSVYTFNFDCFTLFDMSDMSVCLSVCLLLITISNVSKRP